MTSVLNKLVKRLPIFLAIFSVVFSSKAVNRSRIKRNDSAAYVWIRSGGAVFLSWVRTRSQFGAAFVALGA
jgi:hypothetical protein